MRLGHGLLRRFGRHGCCEEQLPELASSFLRSMGSLLFLAEEEKANRGAPIVSNADLFPALKLKSGAGVPGRLSFLTLKRSLGSMGGRQDAIRMS
jgi:hypothetical protein